MKEIKFRIPMFTDKGHFTEFQYLKLGDDILGTLAGHNGDPQQYTGLNDKNGTEICEGDILTLKPEENMIVRVVNEPKLNGYGVRDGKGNWQGQLSNKVGHEIIGNIYQNKDLLK